VLIAALIEIVTKLSNFCLQRFTVCVRITINVVCRKLWLHSRIDKKCYNNLVGRKVGDAVVGALANTSGDSHEEIRDVGS